MEVNIKEPSLQVSRSEQNKEAQILEVAERLFLEKGFALTSTTEIAREAGCTQAMVHYYFRTKERLFVQLFEKKIRLFGEAVTSVPASTSSFIDRLSLRIEAHYDIIRANPRLPFFILNELSINPQRITKVLDNMAFPKLMLNVIQQELDEAVRKGEVRPVRAIDLVLNILSLNAFLPIALSVGRNSKILSDELHDELWESRRKEHVRLIIDSIRLT